MCKNNVNRIAEVQKNDEKWFHIDYEAGAWTSDSLRVIISDQLYIINNNHDRQKATLREWEAKNENKITFSHTARLPIPPNAIARMLII